MANTNSPFGFREFRSNGSAPTYEQVVFPIDFNATNIFFGDPVTLQTDGSIAQSASTGGAPAALGIAGIFVGCKYLSVAQKRTLWSNYWPGSDVASGNFVEGYVINNPNAIFLVQTDATGLAYPPKNGTIGFTIGTGSTSTGISGAFLDTTTLSGSNNNPFKVLGVYGGGPLGGAFFAPAGFPGSQQNGQAYDWAVVMFNNEYTRNLTGP